MKQKQTQNPVFSVLKRISDKKIKVSSELTQNLHVMKSQENKCYFLIPLMTNPKSEHFDGSDCLILDHHISVYETFNDKVYVLSAYHYTATLFVNGYQYTLHSYYNKFGELLDHLIKNSDDQVVKDLDHWHELFRSISNQYTITVLSEIFHTIESLSSNYDHNLQLINTEIDNLSKQVYRHQGDSSSIKVASKNYLAAIKRYIDCQLEYNEISLNRNHTIINFLQSVTENFRVPELPEKPIIKSNSLPRKSKKTSPNMIKLSQNVNRPTANQHDIETPLIPVDIQHILTRLEQLEKKSNAESIIEQSALLKKCTERMKEVPDIVAIELFIKQNTLLKKTKIALMMYLQLGDVESVRLLLPFSSYVNQAMIACAAMKGHISVLTLLLKSYKGPKRFFHHVDELFVRELVCDEKLPTASLKTLLNFGCDKYSIDIYGRSLLLIAVMLDDPLRVEMLIDAKIDVNFHTSKNNHNLIVQPVITFPEGTHLTKKMTTTIQKTLSTIAAIQSTEANKSTPKMTLTPIMCATQRGKLPIIRLLSKTGCNLYETDDNGLNAFSYVLIRPVTNPHYRLKEDIIRYFIDECHMDINMLHGLEDMKKSALHHAIRFRNFSNTAEHAAAILNDIEILLKFNANPNVLSLGKLDTDGTQPLSAFCQAVILDHFDIVELIFQKSQVLLTSETIKHAAVIIATLYPDKLTYFKMQYQRHFNRLVPPLHSIAEDPNSFFNSTGPHDNTGPTNPFEKGPN